MNRFLECPFPSLNLDGKYIRFKYLKKDCCEIPFLRIGRVIQSGEEYFLIEETNPSHGIKKFIRQRIICYEIIHSDLTAMNSGPNDGPKNPFVPE